MSAKAKGPLNSKGLSPWLAYLYMQHLVTLVFVSMREGSPSILGIAELRVPIGAFFSCSHTCLIPHEKKFSPKVKVIPFPLDVYNNGT